MRRLSLRPTCRSATCCLFFVGWYLNRGSRFVKSSTQNEQSQHQPRQSFASRLPIPLPPDAEQRAIAAALSDVDALLDGLDRLIAKKRDLKQAAMQQLLTGQTRLPGFHGEWEVKRLGDVVKSAGPSADQLLRNSGAAESHLVHHWRVPSRLSTVETYMTRSRCSRRSAILSTAREVHWSARREIGSAATANSLSDARSDRLFIGCRPTQRSAVRYLLYYIYRVNSDLLANA